jgi:chemotaxis protein histidine kinase CheA
MLLLCRRSDGPIGLLADGVASRETAVIKPLPRRTRRPDFLGAIVTGTGRVVLVLDIEQLQPPPTFGNLRTTSVSA